MFGEIVAFPSHPGAWTGSARRLGLAFEQDAIVYLG